MKNIVVVLLGLILVLPAYSQSFNFTGSVLDSKDNSQLFGASVQLNKVGVQGSPIGRITDKSGSFNFAGIAPGLYVIEVSFVGYDDLIDTLRLFRKSVEGKKMFLSPKPVKMNEIEITGKAIQAEQKGDTIQFNASAFKTNPDATAEDLVTKIPGIQNDNGTMKAQGEEIKRVLVDGKPFFGDDPSLTLRNLPADVIDKVQVYDRMSDQAQFTGFDDGNSSKAINIITRPNKRNGKFGKLYGGLGDNEKFASGLNLNIFSGDQRITLLGLANNINRQNFSPQDILGTSGSNNSGGGGMFARGGGSGGGGGRRSFGGDGGGSGVNPFNFMVGGQNGITKTYSAGGNFIDTWNKSLQINGSYFFNYAKNANDQSLTRDYFTSSSSSQTYDEKSLSGSQNYNNRLNLRLEYTFDTLNSILYTPSLSFQNNSSTNDVLGVNSLKGSPASSTDYFNLNNTKGNNYSGDFLLRHKFETRGRTVSLNLSTSSNNKTGDGTKNSDNKFYNPTDTTTTIVDQINDQSVNGTGFGVNINYTEPLSENSILQFTANKNWSKDNSDKNGFNINPAGQYTLVDSLQTNNYENQFIYSRGGMSYRLRAGEGDYSAELMYQQSKLIGNELFPVKLQVNKTFGDWLPSFRAHVHLSKTENLRAFYSTNINAPSISQLQNTLDNSNPLFLKTGNQDLTNEYSHRMMINYMTTSPETGTNFFGMLFFNYTKNAISNATYTAINSDTTIRGVALSKYSQLTYPVNLSHSESVRGYINYGLLWSMIRCNINLFFSPTYSVSPGLVNDVVNTSKTMSYSQGLTIASNISEDIDFRLTYNPSFNIAKNDAITSLNDKYTVQNSSVNFNWFIIPNLFVRSDFTYYYNNSNANSGAQQKYYVLNAGIGAKFFSDKSGDLRLEVFDLLNQNKSLTRNVTETYIENKNNVVLKRYFLLTFTYTLKMFGGMGDMMGGQRDRDHGPGHF